MSTRPTPARVRESLFSMVAACLPNASVLDLFAGTGALGIESLSRGARQAVFVEPNRRALAALRHNITYFSGRTSLLPMHAAQAVRRLEGLQRRFDVIFLDPPYALHLLEPTLVLLDKAGLLAEDGIIACEHHGQAAPPAVPAGLTRLRERRFGDVAICLIGQVDTLPSDARQFAPTKEGP